MGPFYEKYIQKMGQMYVKDRVKRLKQTFEVAKKGAHVKVKPSVNESMLTHNSSIYSNGQNNRILDSRNSEGSGDSEQLQLDGRQMSDINTPFNNILND